MRLGRRHGRRSRPEHRLRETRRDPLHSERLGELLGPEGGMERECVGKQSTRDGQVQFHHPAADQRSVPPSSVRHQLRCGGTQLLGQQRHDELRAGGEEVVVTVCVVGRKTNRTEPCPGPFKRLVKKHSNNHFVSMHWCAIFQKL